jgi:ribosomal-protein-alanine acetyltransferase
MASAQVSVLVGFAVASVIPTQAEIETIAVAAEEQRRGTGGRLLRALLDELRPMGVTEVLLEARASNQPALRLYTALGFRQTGVRPRYYDDPQEDAVLMVLQDL